jgi:hypothetical protein
MQDKMMGELHDQGKTISDIEESFKVIPLYLEMIRTIKFPFSLGWVMILWIFLLLFILLDFIEEVCIDCNQTFFGCCCGAAVIFEF